MTTTEPRVPHADRPTARDKCRCMWVYTGNPKDPSGPNKETLYITHPECELHGDNVKEAPF